MIYLFVKINFIIEINKIKKFEKIVKNVSNFYFFFLLLIKIDFYNKFNYNLSLK